MNAAAAPTIRTPINTIRDYGRIAPADIDRAFGTVFRDESAGELRMFAALRTKDGRQFSALANIRPDGIVNDVIVVDGSPHEQAVVTFTRPPNAHPDGPTLTFDQSLDAMSEVKTGFFDARKAARLIDAKAGTIDTRGVDAKDLFIETYGGPDGSHVGIIGPRDFKGAQYAPFQDLLASVVQVNLDNANRGKAPSPFPFPL